MRNKSVPPPPKENNLLLTTNWERFQLTFVSALTLLMLSALLYSERHNSVALDKISDFTLDYAV